MTHQTCGLNIGMAQSHVARRQKNLLCSVRPPRRRRWASSPRCRRWSDHAGAEQPRGGAGRVCLALNYEINLIHDIGECDRRPAVCSRWTRLISEVHSHGHASLGFWWWVCANYIGDMNMRRGFCLILVVSLDLLELKNRIIHMRAHGPEPPRLVAEDRLLELFVFLILWC
jgi:hypothetical protein